MAAVTFVSTFLAVRVLRNHSQTSVTTATANMTGRKFLQMCFHGPHHKQPSQELRENVKQKFWYTFSTSQGKNWTTPNHEDRKNSKIIISSCIGKAHIQHNRRDAVVYLCNRLFSFLCCTTRTAPCEWPTSVPKMRAALAVVVAALGSAGVVCTLHRSMPSKPFIPRMYPAPSTRRKGYIGGTSKRGHWGE